MPKLIDGSKFFTDVTALSSTSDTDCYVVPKNYSARISNLQIINNNSNSRNFTVKYYEKTANTTHTLHSSHALAATSSVSIFTNDNPLFVHAEDKVIVTAGTADTLVDAVVAEEFFNPNK